MGWLDRIFGREEQAPEYGRQDAAAHGGNGRGRDGQRGNERTDDEIAVERYQYLLRTAPPETIEQVHSEAFSKLTPEQRDILFHKLTEEASPADRPVDAQPASLARSATRTEVQQPGTLARTLGGGQGQNGPSFGSMVGSSLLGSVAGFVIGSALVSAFMPMDGGGGDAGAENTGSGEADAGTTEAGGAGGDSGGDFGGGGGGDFGGGDFGGGDFGGF